ncbi:CPBP family intramembrane metalloprotease [Clostridium perfringens]|nr:CPBP family intramembrane metalloprotease [Clostridium perfringens]
MNLNDYFKEICISKMLGIYFLTFILFMFLNEIFFPSHMTSGVLPCILMLLWFLFIFKRNNIDICNEFSKKITRQEKLDGLFLLILNLVFSIGVIFLILSLIDIQLPLDQSLPSTNYSKLIYVIILAPILEELMFRGVILNRLSKWFNITASIIISSILFGILHFEKVIIVAFIFGICMCVLYLKTQNIFVSIYVHICNNLVASLPEIFSLFSSSSNSVQDTNANYLQRIPEIRILAIVLIFISGIFILWYLIKNWPKSKAKLTSHRNNKL